MPYIGNITSDFSIDTGNITNRAVTATKLSPSSVGSNGQVLSVDGSGNLQWGNDSNAPEGTAVLSTGVAGTTKYLRVDGDGTCSWQTVDYINVTAQNNVAATVYPLFAGSGATATGPLNPGTDTGFTYNSSSGALTATSFVGALTGTASNASGATGDFSIADKIVHTGDTDTAIRFSGTDIIQLETGGINRLKIDANGIVQITRRLELTNSGDNHYVYEGRSWTWSSTGISTGTIRAYVYGDSSNNLRIGTNGWNERLQISSTGQILSGTTSSNSSDANAIFAGGGNSGTGDYGKIYISGNYTNPAVNQAVGFVGFSINSLSNHAFAYIGVYTDGAHSGSGDTPARMSFHTTPDGSGTPYERITIKGSGKVGIGATSPDCKLHVNAGAADDALKLESTDNAVNLILTDAAGSSSIQQNNDMLNISSDPSDSISASSIRFLVDNHVTGTFLNNKFQLGSNSAGLLFHGDTAAANALDDYEEGSWSATSLNYDYDGNQAQRGQYVKIGQMVYAFYRIKFHTQSTYTGQHLRWTSLPFTAIGASSPNDIGVSSHAHEYSTIDFFRTYVQPGSSYCYWYTSTGSNFNNSTSLNNVDVRGCIIYRANS